jgi:putative DNA primase/helicase
MLGIIRGAAVKLAPITAGLLAIGEGVETAMAAQQLGVRPAWALGSVGAIAFFPMIDGVQRLVLLGETGQSSADAIMQCGARWRKVGRKVQVRMPRAGSDLNDELMAVAQ